MKKLSRPIIETPKDIAISRSLILSPHVKMMTFFIVVLLLLPLWAVASEPPKPSFKDNLRFTVDFSSRITHFGIQDTEAYIHALGFDMHKVFSTNNKDVGTLILQGYLTRIDNHPAPPGIFDDGDDSEFIYRIFNFNYTGFNGNTPNVRIGHLEIPYGLEQDIPTNGTLRQYQQVRNLGIKADWGMSLNKQLTHIEYEVSVTSGGNQKLESQNGSFVYAGRVGTPQDANTVYGLSFYRSQLGVGELQRKRIGLDMRRYYGRHGLFAELSLGENNDQDVRNGLLEWNITNNRESFLYYTQLSYLSADTSAGSNEEALQGIAGFIYTPDNHWAASMQYNRDITVFSGSKRQTLFSAQLRYRY